MLELTYEVKTDFKKAQEMLEKNGYELRSYSTMEDCYFSRFDDEELRTLTFETIMNNSILLRQMCDEHLVNYLCFKSKSYDENGNVINEEKIQTTVAQYDVACDVLKRAGLNNFAGYLTHLYVYEKGEDCFALQKIDGLGLFIEYEEDNRHEGLSLKEKEEALKEGIFATGLQFGDDPYIKKVKMYLDKKFDRI